MLHHDSIQLPAPKLQQQAAPAFCIIHVAVRGRFALCVPGEAVSNTPETEEEFGAQEFLPLCCSGISVAGRERSQVLGRLPAWPGARCAGALFDYGARVWCTAAVVSALASRTLHGYEGSAQEYP